MASPVLKEESLENRAVSTDDSNSDTNTSSIKVEVKTEKDHPEIKKEPQTGIQWSPGVKEAMCHHGLDEDSIRKLGEDGFRNFEMLDKLDVDSTMEELRQSNFLNAAQRCAFRSMINSRRENISQPESNGDTKPIGTVMKQEHVDILLKCRVTLAENMKNLQVIEQLVAEKVLTHVDRYQIKSKPNPYDQNIELLDIIQTQSDEAFFSLVKALKTFHQTHLADLLQENIRMGKSIYNQSLT